MAESGEVEFVRRTLVGAGLLPAARLDAWLARWSGEGSLLRFLVDIGALERSAAATLTAVMQGKLRLSSEALRGLIRLGGEQPVPEDRGPKPSAAPEEASASTSRGPIDPPASATPSQGPIDPSASASMSRAAIDPSASASMSRAAIDPSASTSRGRGVVSMSLGARALASLLEDRGAPAGADPSASTSRGAVEPSASTSRGAVGEPSASTSRGAARGRGRGPVAPELHAAVDAALGRERASAEAAAAASPVLKAISAAAAFERLAPGQVVAGYELRKLLGRGPDGAVFRGWSEEQGHSAVLKLLRPTGAAPGPAVAAVAAVHEQLRHPGVVALLATGEHAGLGYLVYEDLFAVSLAEYLEGAGPLPSVPVARIGVDVGETLAAAARRGLVHGDLRPGNMLVHGPDVRVKLTDFASHGPREASVYRAPELASGERPADARADMYSLGAALYQAASGRPPLVRQAVDATSEPVAVAARPVHMLVPAFSRALSAVISRLMSKRADDRPASWDEVVAALVAAEPAAAAGRSDMSDRAAVRA